MKTPSEVFEATKIIDDIYRTAKDAYDARRADSVTSLTWNLPKELRPKALTVLRELFLSDNDARIANMRAQLESMGIAVTDADIEAQVAAHAERIKRWQEEEAAKKAAENHRKPMGMIAD